MHCLRNPKRAYKLPNSFPAVHLLGFLTFHELPVGVQKKLLDSANDDEVRELTHQQNCRYLLPLSVEVIRELREREAEGEEAQTTFEKIG